jgi:hypothetical protein
MKNTRDLQETTDLNHRDLITTRVISSSQEVVSEVASEEATVMVETSEVATAMVASSEVAIVMAEPSEVATVMAESSEETTTTVEETSAVHPEVASEVETQLEALVVSADRVVETMALAELALTNNEKGSF